MTKVLYFDIDGTFVDYDDLPKKGLLDGKLEACLKAAEFDHLACVSGWSDIFAEPVMRLNYREQREAMYQKLAPLFPDKEWFMKRIILLKDTDHRCKYIDLNVDWYYVDDWAEKFFQEAHGELAYQKEIGNRILLCDHKGDGADILKWLAKKRD